MAHNIGFIDKTEGAKEIIDNITNDITDDITEKFEGEVLEVEDNRQLLSFHCPYNLFR